MDKEIVDAFTEAYRGKVRAECACKRLRESLEELMKAATPFTEAPIANSKKREALNLRVVLEVVRIDLNIEDHRRDNE